MTISLCQRPYGIAIGGKDGKPHAVLGTEEDTALVAIGPGIPPIDERRKVIDLSARVVAQRLSLYLAEALHSCGGVGMPGVSLRYRHT